MVAKNTGIILTHNSLSQFFYKNLSSVNQKSLCPLPAEFMLYASEVLDKYSLSDEFFEFEDGRAQEKLFGTKILEAQHLPSSERVSVYKDVGDTVLVLLGMFKKRVQKKAIDEAYYVKMAQTAYHNLGVLDCKFYDIPNFYKFFATSFERTTHIVETMFKSGKYKNIESFLLHEGAESDFALIKNLDKKVS